MHVQCKYYIKKKKYVSKVTFHNFADQQSCALNLLKEDSDVECSII